MPISPKRLVEKARKWQKNGYPNSSPTKGHFVVYTREGRRFVVPLAHLDTDIFQGLLRISEEEFGLPCHQPIMLPCDGVFMEIIIALLRGPVSGDVEKALLAYVYSGFSSFTSKEN